MTHVSDLRYSSRSPTTAAEPCGPALALGARTWLPLHAAVTRIGRRAGCDLQLDDDTVSHRHALLINSPVGVVLLDDRSATGTFVNGERTTRAILEPGDEVRFGRVTLRFVD